MKTTEFRFPIISLFSFLFFCTHLLAADVDGVSSLDVRIALDKEESSPGVVWSSASSPSSVVSSVDGKRLLIDGSLGEITLDSGPTTLYADTKSIKVTLQDNPVVRASKHHESQLIVRTSSHKKVSFHLKHDNLTFKGSRDKKHAPLLIFIAPGSNVEFIINSGQTVLFTSERKSGGTAVVVGLSDKHETRLAFIHNSAFRADRSDKNVMINIGKRSSMSFVSENWKGVDRRSGVISFDPTNEVGSSGRMILDIAKTGAFIIRPSLIADIEFPRLAGIDTRILTNGASRVEIVNSGNHEDAQASLQVINRNNRLFDLLSDPFLTLEARYDIQHFSGKFSGIQFGFVLGANGVLDIGDNAFLDYVGLANNQCPIKRCLSNELAANNCCPDEACVLETDCFLPCVEDIESLVKPRNPSAFFVDGTNDPCANAARINLGNHSAIFFRSGVDKCGVVEHPHGEHQFTINPMRATPGIGEIVFDVEGLLKVEGSNGECSLLSKLEILSLEVDPTGGSLFYNSDEVIFPKRTCARDACFFRQYNSASFLINNRLELFDTVLVHTDQNHKVIRNNDVCSEPAYVGGEIARFLECGAARPKIVFFNSRLFVHTDVAFTGLDLSIPNLALPVDVDQIFRKSSSWQESCDVCDDDCQVEAIPTECQNNISEFRFFYNGNCIDRGIGRQMILGTLVGSFACDNCQIISADAHLDVVPESCCNESGNQVEQLLVLTTAANTGDIICELDDQDITGQFALQTIFLGNASNISIGTQIDNQENCCF